MSTVAKRVVFVPQRLAPFLGLAVSLLALFAMVAMRVGAQEPTLSFGIGPGIQLVDPTGRSQMPISVRTSDPIDFALYPLTDAEFMARVRPDDWSNPAPIDVAGLTAATTWQQTFAPATWGVPQFVEIPTSPPRQGLYAVEAGTGAHRATAIVSVSSVVMMAKEGADGQLLVWAATLQSGEPASQLTVTLYDETGIPLAGQPTDDAGLARFDAIAGHPVYAIGRNGETATALGLSREWRTQEGNWWVETVPTRYQVYLHTDRPLYRPGQTIYFNAIVRSKESGSYALPAPTTPVVATLQDARKHVVTELEMNIDEYGAVQGEFLLGDEPPLGRYTLLLTVDGETTEQALQVEAYRKPEYAVAVHAPNAYIVAGDTIPLTVEATYFFGQPVADADVTIQVSRDQIYRGYWWMFDTPMPYYGSEIVTELTGKTDADGRLHVDFTPEVIAETDWRYSFVATVTDALEQPVQSETTLSVFWSGVALSVRGGYYGYATGDPIDVAVRVQDRAGAPLAGRTVGVRLVPGWTDQDADDPAQQSRDVLTDEDGVATTTFTGVAQGWYDLVATTTDKRGRVVRSTSYVWVYGDSAEWWFPTPDALTLQLDQETYAPGDTARLLIQSRLSGVGLLTIQRDQVLEERVVRLTGPVTAVDLTVHENWTPNVHLSFYLFAPTDAGSNRAGRLHWAATDMTVPAADKRLEVTITPDKNAYRPGDTAEITIDLRDHGGAPVAGRVAVALVDEAIFALQADLSANLFDAFYGPYQETTRTYDPLVREPYLDVWWAPPMATAEPAPSATASPVELDGDAAADEPRRNFLDTAYWQPIVDVGANGRAVLTVPLPDNLTTWRIVVKAYTATTAVGESTGPLLVTQEIIAQPALPRFAILGDRFQVGVVGRNFSAATAAGTLNLESAQLQMLDAGPRDVTLAPGATTRSNWTVVAADVGPATVLSTMATDQGRDASAITLPIKPFAVPDWEAFAGQANPVAEEEFTIPLNAINEATSLTVRLTPSIALGVLDGLDELIDYPYGCVEQTMSRVLPTAVASRFYAELGLTNPRADELPDIIAQGLQKLYGYQHQDGGWGWFYDDEGAVYTSAYVLMGLTQVQQTGIAVDASVLARGFDYLDAQLPAMSDPGMIAYVLYVKAAANRADLEATRALFARRNELDVDGLATLALAFTLAGDKAAAQPVVDQLLARGVETATHFYWPTERAGWDPYHWRVMASEDKNTALALSALVQTRPDDARLHKIVRWLLDNRRGAGWSNTQATAFAVLGLLDYLHLSGELTADYSYRVLLNDVEIQRGQVTPATATTPIAPINVPADLLQVGRNRLRIEHDGPTFTVAQLAASHEANPLYYSATLRRSLFYDAFQPVSSADTGLRLERSYRLVEGAPHADGAYAVGDIVDVTLNLTLNRELYYLIVQDPLPAGFEALNERLNPMSWSNPWDSFFWYDWGYNRKDLRDDRVDFFITYGWQGTHQLTYRMRATTAGEFSVPPGEAYAMYADDLWGRSGSDRLVVAPARLATRPPLTGDIDGNCRLTDFDVRLVAAAWPNANPFRDTVQDGVIDLRDLAAVGQRRGAACTADRPIVTAAAATLPLELTAPQAPVGIGQRTAVQISPADQRELTGLAAMLAFDPTHLRVVDVAWINVGDHALALGPSMDQANGRVLLGAYDLTFDTAVRPTAVVTFVGTGVGTSTVHIVTGQAVDGDGRVGTVDGDAGITVNVTGSSIYLPQLSVR